MIHKNLFFLLFVASLVSCASANKHRSKRGFDKQAHRGGRGLMPENTIASEKNAINIFHRIKIRILYFIIIAK